MSSLRRRDDEHEAWEHALALCAALLGRHDAPSRATAPASPARRALAARAREALAADPDLSLADLRGCSASRPTTSAASSAR